MKRTALVTGGNRGIGLAIIRQLAEIGHGVLLGAPGAYGATKAVLNALTVRLSKELPATIKANAMCPGWVRTRMGGENATRSPEEAADTAIWLATLPENGPTGGFFRDRKPIQW